MSFTRFCLWITAFFCWANVNFATHSLVVPQCLLSKNFSYKVLAKHQSLSLIHIEDLKKFHQVRRQKRPDCRGFIDVTEALKIVRAKDYIAFLKNYNREPHPSDFTKRYKIRHRAEVKPLLEKVDKTAIYAGLLKLTQWPDRNVLTPSGKQAAVWIEQQLQALAHDKPHISVFRIMTLGNLRQPSIVLRMGEQNLEDAIVIGTHFDTLPAWDDKQPGANNNASGTMTLLEVARILIESDYVFKKPVYLIWYAGSEAGRLGSQSVVAYFNQMQIPVGAVLELDQTGYQGLKDAEIGMSDDSTDAGLNVFVADLVAAYLKIPVGVMHCGFACSDHVLWYQNGNRVAYPTASMREEGNPYIHTKKDTLDTLSLDQIENFVKLSLAFAIELAELVNQ